MATNFDVVVVGAGASGAAATWRLSTLGLSVLCLEQGDWVDPALSPSTKVDWEIQRQKQWHPNPELRNGPSDYPVDATESAIRPWFYNGVGGSTVLWSCHIPRFHASDFTMYSDDGVGDDWPLTLADLEPYYRLNEKMMGVAGLAGYPDYYHSSDAHCSATGYNKEHRTAPASIGKHGIRMAAAFDRLGWSWWPADLAIHTGPEKADRQKADRQTCNNCGPCELHCPRRAKASVDIRYWPPALAAGAQLRTGARVFGIDTDSKSRVQRVQYLDRNSVVHTVNTKTLMLGANGIGTPRLLMLAANKHHPNGLANRSGLVGKRLMLHPLARVTGRFAEPTDSYRGISAGAFVSHHFYDTDKSRNFYRGIKLQLLGTQGPALVSLGSLGSRIPWGDIHHQQFSAWFNHSLALSICSDDLPETANRVELDHSRIDSDGLPGVCVFYKISENTRRSLDFGIDKAKQAMQEAGASESIVMSNVPDSGFHLMGTCRMGDDPDNSVLNKWGESHDVGGLFVIDGSAFVTAAAVNPTNTLQALALRAADYLYRTRNVR